MSSESGIPTRCSATENIAWKTAIPGEGWSSPIIYDDYIFLTATQDEGASCPVLCVDRRDGTIRWDSEVSKFRVLARNSIGEKCKASIAISRGNLLIRSEGHLFCIGDAPK